MSKLSELELSEICNEIGELYPKNIRQIFGGSIHSCWKIDFPTFSLFIKKNNHEKKFLKFEQYCLQDLRKYIDSENLIIPKVNSYLNIKNKEFLIMEWVDMTNNHQGKLGRGLAEMHLNSNKNNPEKFGYSENGFIGLNNQIGGWDVNWVDCFINLRIRPQLKLFKIDLLNSDLIESLIFKIKSILHIHKPTISLVHGDLWSGNFGISNENKGVIFDPASWWADSEVDIAMSKLFGGFNEEFYKEYFKIIPKKEGFEKRVIIYNFYHVLNHANLFGGSYVQQTNEYIKVISNM